MQKIIIIGTIGGNATVQQYEGSPIVKFSVAVNNNKTGVADWYNADFWNALKIAEHIRKGEEIYVEGKLALSLYQDKAGFWKIERKIVVDKVQLLGKRAKLDNTPPPPPPPATGETDDFNDVFGTGDAANEKPPF